MCRLNSQEKLGLTLCYRTDEEEDVAIYVSEVSTSLGLQDDRLELSSKGSFPSYNTMSVAS